MDIKLISSPLQGFTDYPFRNAFDKHFGGIDTFYAPYIRLKGKQEIKRSNQRDLSANNNYVENLIPQVMCNSVNDFLFVADYVQSLGYSEINWNLGCPYPMVTTRQLGSGLIPFPERIDEILIEVLQKSTIRVSVKLRLGLQNKEEILNVLPVLNRHKIESVAIHPRLGKQLYKGTVDLDAFEDCISICQHPLHYNGNIHSYSDFTSLNKRFPTINTWLLGRGIIANPYLPQMIRNESDHLPKQFFKAFASFHNDLLTHYSESLSGDKHLILKMYQYWEYFIFMFPSSPKALKAIKKSKRKSDYESIVTDLILTESRKNS
jgi:tRNA-dihydrouridine synthase